MKNFIKNIGFVISSLFIICIVSVVGSSVLFYGFGYMDSFVRCFALMFNINTFLLAIMFITAEFNKKFGDKV